MTESPSARYAQRMIEDMAVRKFGAKTQNDYIRASRISRPSSADRPTRRPPRTCAASSCI